MLKSIKELIEKIVKDTKRANYYYKEIERVIASYNNPEEAARIITERFSIYVKFDFNEDNFKAFVMSIDPNFVPKKEVESSDTDYRYDCSERCSLECTKASSKECIKSSREGYRQKRIEENKKNPKRMEDLRIYALLQRDSITDADRLAKENAPGTSAQRLIYTPSGRQPGYRLKNHFK